MLKFYATLLSFKHDIARDRDEKGATAVEYGLLVALIAAAIIAVVLALGGNLSGLFETVSDRIGDSTPTDGGGGGDADG